MIKTVISLIVLTVVIITWQTIASVKGRYEYETTIGAEWSLADKSSTIPAKMEHLDKFVAALEGSGLHGQYDAVLFPTPDNSFDANLAALKTLQNRLHEIEKMDVTSFQYQTAIQQITAQEQGEAHKMLEVFNGVWWKVYHLMQWRWIQVLWISIPLVVLFIICIIGFIRDF